MPLVCQQELQPACTQCNTPARSSMVPAKQNALNCWASGGTALDILISNTPQLTATLGCGLVPCVVAALRADHLQVILLLAFFRDRCRSQQASSACLAQRTLDADRKESRSCP
jgi:hypothetical protein